MMPNTGTAESKASSDAAVSTKHGIVVLDFGGQYTQLIARRIREQEVFSAVLPCTAKVEEVRAFEPVGIVLSGGPSSGGDRGAPPGRCMTRTRRIAIRMCCSWGFRFWGFATACSG